MSRKGIDNEQSDYILVAGVVLMVVIGLVIVLWQVR